MIWMEIHAPVMTTANVGSGSVIAIVKHYGDDADGDTFDLSHKHNNSSRKSQFSAIVLSNWNNNVICNSIYMKQNKQCQG